MLTWIENELGITIDLRKAFIESATIVSAILIAYAMFRWL